MSSQNVLAVLGLVGWLLPSGACAQGPGSTPATAQGDPAESPVVARVGNRTITLADGSITSPFLEMFGRPARDTGLESERNNHATDAQRLFLPNSSLIQERHETRLLPRRLVPTNRGNPRPVWTGPYLARPPGPPPERGSARCRFRAMRRLDTSCGT